MTFDQIATHGQDRWLEELRQELRDDHLSAAAPAARVDTKAAMGVSARLAIPCIRDRVVEMATLLVLGPIFPRRTCWVAISMASVRGWTPRWRASRQAFRHVSDHGRSEIVDADLSDYFSSIPHGPLMRCVSRRVADGTSPVGD